MTNQLIAPPIPPYNKPTDWQAVAAASRPTITQHVQHGVALNNPAPALAQHPIPVDNGILTGLQHAGAPSAPISARPVVAQALQQATAQLTALQAGTHQTHAMMLPAQARQRIADILARFRRARTQ